MMENTGSEPRRRNLPNTSERAGSAFSHPQQCQPHGSCSHLPTRQWIPSPLNFSRPQPTEKSPLLRHAVRSNGSALLRPHEKRASAKRTGALPLFVLAASPQTYHLSSTKVCPRRKCACKDARHVPPNRRSREAETRGRGGLVPTLSGNYSPRMPFLPFPVFPAFRTSSLCRR